VSPRSGVVRGGVHCCMVVATLAGIACKASAQTPSVGSVDVSRQPPSIRVSPENARVSNYLHDLAGPGAFMSIIGGSALDQLRQKHRSFDDGANSFAQQLASRAGQAAVEVSVRHGLAAVMHRSTGYQPCDCHGFGARVQHALLETFTDRRADGTRALSVPTIAGTYAGNFARLGWEHDRSLGNAALDGTLSLGFSALFNIARELTGVGR
jgi:hypothetical protein